MLQMLGMPKLIYGVVILGAGASRRMGQPKLLLPWHGTTVIGQLLNQWRRLGASQIAVVTRIGDHALDRELDRQGLSATDRIRNVEPELGMYQSIRLAALWPGWQNDLTHWLITLGDQPHLRDETLSAIMDFAAQQPAAICQPGYAGRGRHPVILPAAAFRELPQPGHDNLKEFLQHTTYPVSRLPLDDADLERDMDTPEDYLRLNSPRRTPGAD